MREHKLKAIVLGEGFFGSAVLLALFRMNVFQALGDGERSSRDLASNLQVSAPLLERLLDAGVAVGILASAGESVFRIHPNWHGLLWPESSEHFIGDHLRFLDNAYGALGRLSRAVEANGPAGAPGIMDDPQPRLSARSMTLALHRYAAAAGLELARVLSTEGCESLLDLGCGPGTYAFILGQHNPRLDLYLLDLPDVLAVTREIQSRYALSNRVRYLELDVTRDDIPGRYDLVLLSNVLHVLGVVESTSLLKRVHSLLNPGGSVVVQGQFLDKARSGGTWPVLLDLYMLATTVHGRNHTVAETMGWLSDAGFRDMTHSRMSVFNRNSVVRAYR